MSQSIDNQPGDNDCYSYEVTLKLLSESTIQTYGINNDLQGDHEEFFTSEFSKYENNEYIINKIGCEYNEDSRDFRILQKLIYNVIPVKIQL